MIEVIFILYLSLIIFVGILSNKFVSSQLDFLLAGRKLGPWVTAFSERASGESAWLLLGLPGCLLYTSPSPRDLSTSRMPSSA